MIPAVHPKPNGQSTIGPARRPDQAVTPSDQQLTVRAVQPASSVPHRYHLWTLILLGVGTLFYEIDVWAFDPEAYPALFGVALVVYLGVVVSMFALDGHHVLRADHTRPTAGGQESHRDAYGRWRQRRERHRHRPGKYRPAAERQGKHTGADRQGREDVRHAERRDGRHPESDCQVASSRASRVGGLGRCRSRSQARARPFTFPIVRLRQSASPTPWTRAGRRGGERG